MADKKYPSQRPEAVKARYHANREAILAKAKVYRDSKGPDHNLKNNLKPYGLTIEQYDSMRADQGGCCASCKTPTFRRRSAGKGVVDQVDHCHKTGKVRGLLCTGCNTALGLLKEDLGRITALGEYLEKHQ